MESDPNKTTGMALLIKGYKQKFRIPENLDHYSDEDYQEAEKKFIKLCLHQGVGLQPDEG